MTELRLGEWSSAVCREDGTRLDVFVAAAFPELSRSRAQKLIDEENVLLNGAPAKANTKLKAGDRVEVRVPPPKKIELAPEEIPLEVLHDDADIAVIDKPAGLVVHPGAGHEEGTLVNALLHRYGAELSAGRGIGGELRPGIVHRIDRNTSGILLITKTETAHKHLSHQFKEHTITRKYKGLCWGELPPQGAFEGAIARDPKERKRMAVVSHGRRALTRYTRLAIYQKALSLFEAELFTGRTHQIRVHFSHAGHPLAGDSVYTSVSRAARVKKEEGMRILQRKCPKAAALLSALQESGRQFLHAAELGFQHPVSGKAMHFTSALPPDLEEIVLELEQCR